MTQADKDTLYGLLRDHGSAIGASRTTMVALEAFSRAINELTCAPDQFRTQILELTETIKSSEPRIPALIHLIKQFEKDISPFLDNAPEEIKAKSTEILSDRVEFFNKKVEGAISQGLGYISDGDVILVHSASYVVVNILIEARAMLGKQFRVIVLDQDARKTRQLINELNEADIDLTVVPEYDLSQYLAQADKLFIGALSITQDRKVIARIGTANIVGMCHFHNVPVYLFGSSYKFSYHPSNFQRVHRKKEDVETGECTYHVTSFSHSVFDLDLIDHTITEFGEMGKQSHSEFLP